MMDFDPNRALESLRELETRMRQGRNFHDVDQFRKLMVSLDEWLTAGGYPPAAWDPFSKQPDTVRQHIQPVPLDKEEES